MQSLNYRIEARKNLQVALILQIKVKLISEQVHSLENLQKCQIIQMLQLEKQKID